jgi:hypothetical protein
MKLITDPNEAAIHFMGRWAVVLAAAFAAGLAFRR